ncbi:uroporphyrinogen-III C-methyltransferase [Pseudarthrobacter sp. J1738]|uniref:uroporphyrinogen-III C-methyltransferase n=1 Tax=unclassified Pseudarthrobacter TaxID=2647000 RepID=UPI003D2CD20C
MELSIDLTGREVLLIGAEQVARQAMRRYQAAGAVVFRLSTPQGESTDGPLPEHPFLVAAVDDGQPGWEPLLNRCRAAGIPVAIEPPAGPAGHVTLVGGGPGTEDLLTLGALNALRDADVVFYDRLAPHHLLAELSTAELIDVGKTPGHHKVSQAGIEEQMVSAALSGANVLRLKGGDPFVFGRGGEEVAACVAAGVPVHVISGVTSAIAVPAAAGIPVTHRGVSHLFTVVSGHAPLNEEEHQHLAGLGGTIVVLMGIGTLPSLVAGLRRAGLSETTPAAVIERGFGPGQRTTTANLGTLVDASSKCSNPAVLVIGEVVRVAEQNRGRTLGAATGDAETLQELAASLLGA